MEKLIELYAGWSGEKPAKTEKIAGAGSNREYYRFTDAAGKTVIGVIGTSRDENHAFIYLAEHLNSMRRPGPTGVCVSDDELR